MRCNFRQEMVFYLKFPISVLVILLLLVLPLHINEGEPSYRQAHAFVGKLILKGVKLEAKLILKTWLKGVAKKEGKRVALAAVKSLKALPQDPAFRLSIKTALSGGSYVQVAALTTQRAGQLAVTGAKEQWQEDKQILAENPQIVAHSLGQFTGNRVEGKWNNLDDKLTCGSNNKDIELKALDTDTPHGEHHYDIADTPNDKLLTGRSLLQRALLKGMMRNSTFQNTQEAQKTAAIYSRLACVGGKSRKITSFMGGIAIKRKDEFNKLQDIRSETTQFMNKLDQWVKIQL